MFHGFFSKFLYFYLNKFIFKYFINKIIQNIKIEKKLNQMNMSDLKKYVKK